MLTLTSALPRHSRRVNLNSYLFLFMLCVHMSRFHCLFSLHAFADDAHGAMAVLLLVGQYP